MGLLGGLGEKVCIWKGCQYLVLIISRNDKNHDLVKQFSNKTLLTTPMSLRSLGSVLTPKPFLFTQPQVLTTFTQMLLTCTRGRTKKRLEEMDNYLKNMNSSTVPLFLKKSQVPYMIKILTWTKRLLKTHVDKICEQVPLWIKRWLNPSLKKLTTWGKRETSI